MLRNSDRFCLPALAMRLNSLSLQKKFSIRCRRLVEFGVQRQRQRPPWVLRDYDLCAALVGSVVMALPSKALSAINPPKRLVDQRSDADRIETVAGQQDEADQIAERVGQREYFGRHAALGAADRLVLRPPFCALTVALDCRIWLPTPIFVCPRLGLA